MPSTPLQQPLLHESSPPSFDDIARQSPSLVHRTRALEAAYRNVILNSRIEERNEGNFESLRNFGDLE
jgi:hypothetical protein